MSDLMLRGVILMPYEMAMRDELSRRQFYSRAQALLADYDRLREALLWNSGALQACCSEGIREASNITIAAETKCFSEILDMADAALAQEQGGSDASL